MATNERIAVLAAIILATGSLAFGDDLKAKQCSGERLTYRVTQSLDLPNPFNGKTFSVTPVAYYGNNDLLIATKNAVGVAKNSGGTFEAPSPIGVQGSIGQAVLADLDGDHNLDLAWAGYKTAVNVLFGKGVGRFADLNSPMSLDVPRSFNTIGVQAADLNHDGHLDLVSAMDTQSGGQDGISVFLNLGKRKFSQAAYYRTSFGSSDKYKDGVDGVENLLIADVNGDGKPDLIGLGEWSVQVFLNQNKGTFTQKARWTKLNHESSVARVFVAGDFNGDGKLDLAIMDEGVVEVVLGNGDGSFDVTRDIPVKVSGTEATHGPIGQLIAMDVNGDDKLDLVYTLMGAFKDPHNSASDIVKRGIGVLLGRGDGTFVLGPQFYSDAKVEGNGSSLLATVDLSGKGIPSFAVVETADNGFEPRQRLVVFTGQCSK